MPNFNEFLKRWKAKEAQIESNGGRNTNHRMMTRGIHKGTAAIGSYGLMPAEVNSIIARQGNTVSPQIKALQNLQYPDMKRQLEENPDLQESLVDLAAARLYQKHGGNEEKMAYAWNQGSNLPTESITPEKLEASPYVQKFRALKNLVPMGDVAQLPDFESLKEELPDFESLKDK